MAYKKYKKDLRQLSGSFILESKGAERNSRENSAFPFCIEQKRNTKNGENIFSQDKTGESVPPKEQNKGTLLGKEPIACEQQVYIRYR